MGKAWSGTARALRCNGGGYANRQGQARLGLEWWGLVRQGGARIFLSHFTENSENDFSGRYETTEAR